MKHRPITCACCEHPPEYEVYHPDGNGGVLKYKVCTTHLRKEIVVDLYIPIVDLSKVKGKIR